ncbi:hypothetical protein K1T71_014724 [Dendrolimus kikuchii]|nr:hypothetical protein K1T71_014724 [Dendrolimus kikuchii]
MKAYLDTGSELNVISKAAVDAIKLKVTPVEIILKGFNNSLVRAVGQVEFELLVDKVEIKTTAVATDVDLGDVVLIIGQTVINREDVILNVSKNGVNLSMVTGATCDLMNIDICGEASSFRVELTEDITIPIGDNLVKVNIAGDHSDDFCTRPRQYSMGNVVYAVASTMLRNGKGYVRVCNIGTGPISWKKGMMVARADRCTDIEVKDDSYHNKRLKDDAYNKLLAYYQITIPSATIDTVKRKINNLKSTFRKELKKSSLTIHRYAVNNIKNIAYC